MAAICAAFFTNDINAFSLDVHNYTVGAVSFHLAGERLGSGVRFAPRYENEEVLLGKAATCALTETPWRAEFVGKRIEMRIKGTTFKA